MVGILQEGRSRVHVLQNPGPTFHAQILFYPTEFGNQSNQAGRFVGIELIDDEDPFRLGIGGHGGPDMLDAIVLGAGISDRGIDDPVRGHLEVGDQCLRAVADVFELLGFRLAGCHRPGGVEAFQRLDAGFLVGADQMHTPRMEFSGLMIESAHRPHVFPEVGFIRHFVIQPVAGSVGFEIALIVKSDPRWSRKSAPRYPAHGFMRQFCTRPVAQVFRRFSQATANIWHTCSVVKVPGHPGRGLSANSAPTAARKRLGWCSNFVKSGLALHPAPPPQAHRLFSHPPLSGDSLARTPLAGGQKEGRTRNQAMRNFAAADNGLEESTLFREQVYGGDWSGHVKKRLLSNSFRVSGTSLNTSKD